MAKNKEIRGVIVAIDGTSASGKSTLAKNLARIYDCSYLLTGNIYRALAKELLERQVDLHDGDFIPDLKNCISLMKAEDFDSPNLQSDDVSHASSIIAARQEVRDVLAVFQRDWILKQKGAIVEGRDIGTVIWPQAEVKFYITASIEVRARRRYQQMMLADPSVCYEKIYRDLECRDLRDKERQAAPLTKAQDAFFYDFSDFSVEESTETMVKIIEKQIDKLSNRV